MLKLCTNHYSTKMKSQSCSTKMLMSGKKCTGANTSTEKSQRLVQQNSWGDKKIRRHKKYPEKKSVAYFFFFLNPAIQIFTEINVHQAAGNVDYHYYSTDKRNHGATQSFHMLGYDYKATKTWHHACWSVSFWQSPDKNGETRTYECKVHRPRGAWEDGPYTGPLKKCINPYTNVIQVYTKAWLDEL